MQQLKPELYDAVIKFPYSAEIMLHIGAQMKKTLLECGAGFPILLLHGLPANGKTSTAKVCLTRKDVIVKFAQGLKTVKGEMEKDLAGHIILLDNYPKFLSHYKREKSLRILDYVIDIASEESNGPAVMMTAEPNILEELQKAESMRERLLFVPVPKIDEDDKLNGIRDYLTINRKDYLKLMEQFDQWFEKNPVITDELIKELSYFRREHKKYTGRCTGLVFSYYYACIIFSKFLEEEYKISLEEKIIHNNVMQLFEWKEDVQEKQKSIVAEIWEELLENENAFEILKPRESVCECLLPNGYDGCSKNDKLCWSCGDREDINYYNPMETRIQKGEKIQAVLIENPKQIYGFPKYVACENPLLIIENSALFCMMNIGLEDYSRRKKIHTIPFSPKKLNKELFLNNLCLFEYVGMNHNTYTFPLLDTEGNNIRVVMMKLTKKQYEKLNKRAKTLLCERLYTSEEVKKINRCWKIICTSVQSLFGEIGKYSEIGGE